MSNATLTFNDFYPGMFGNEGKEPLTSEVSTPQMSEPLSSPTGIKFSWLGAVIVLVLLRVLFELAD